MLVRSGEGAVDIALIWLLFKFKESKAFSFQLLSILGWMFPNNAQNSKSVLSLEGIMDFHISHFLVEQQVEKQPGKGIAWEEWRAVLIEVGRRES